MKIIIFGHTGMLGKALIEHLNNSHEIVGISRNANSNLSIENHLWQDLSNVLKKNKFLPSTNVLGSDSVGLLISISNRVNALCVRVEIKGKSTLYK